MVELIFVRHGQTDWNLDGRLQGIKDIPLNETGISEAEDLLKKIDFNVTKIFSSPLIRSSKTAQILNKKLNVEIQYDNRIMERSFGSLAGEKACFVKSMENSLNDNGVESIELFKSKLLRFLDDCSVLAPGRYLVVTHGGVIITLLSHLTNNELNWENTPIKNCTISSLTYSDNWKIDYYNIHDNINKFINRNKMLLTIEN